MMIHDITKLAGKYRSRKRVGRGRGSGLGKTAGRGHKGHRSRAGFAAKTAFEGGQMPYFRRMPKRGFSNAGFRTRFWIVNLGDIVAHPLFARGGEVTPARLIEAGLIRDESHPLKILANLKGDADAIHVALNVAAARVSKSARRLIEAAGGSVEETGSRRDRVRGVDRASGSLEPTNLTKKLKRLHRRRKGEKAPPKAAKNPEE